MKTEIESALKALKSDLREAEEAIADLILKLPIDRKKIETEILDRCEIDEEDRRRILFIVDIGRCFDGLPSFVRNDDARDSTVLLGAAFDGKNWLSDDHAKAWGFLVGPDRSRLYRLISALKFQASLQKQDRNDLKPNSPV